MADVRCVLPRNRPATIVVLVRALRGVDFDVTPGEFVGVSALDNLVLPGVLGGMRRRAAESRALVTNLLAAFPGQRAARLPVNQILRTE